MLRVGLVYGSLDGGGSLRNYYDTLARKLNAREGIEPIIIYKWGEPSESTPSVRLYQTPQRKFPRWHRAVEDLGLDLVHLNTIPAFGQYSVVQSPCPVVATVHGNLHWENNIEADDRDHFTRLRWRVRDVLGGRTLTRLFAVSPYVAEVLQSRARVERSKIEVTYEGVEDRYYEEPVTEQPETDKPYIFHVSNAAPKKNVRTLVRAFDRVADVVDDISLVIAGDGWESQLGQLTEQRRGADRVHFLGYVSNKKLLQLYDHATVFAFPSLHETFGLPNIEAMARKTPVVTSAVDGIQSVLGDAPYYVSDPLNEEELAQALITVITDSMLAKNLVESGTKKAQKYRWENHVNMVTEKYQELCE